MTQTRIVLDPQHKPKAELILQQTGITTLSQLFSILLVCYGDHLIAGLRGQPLSITTPTPQPRPPVKSQHQNQPFTQMAGL
ncbi:MAG: hypothetical protein KME32_33545 [Mojavia pulchra JT2-VF2]|jgi:hypothetical protein|uniref:Uncharacterized protein n=1 Tax=Mojavia pulchra JT2-VF2 TaxID=287848 RepID=A0A951UJR8_9NOST|nr:hypothetical protein [Mojavia pulchra JT2-VF2]